MPDVVGAVPDDLACALGGDVDYDAPLRNALAHGFAGELAAANRPTHSLLCRWIHSGWQRLVPGLHPWRYALWPIGWENPPSRPTAAAWPLWHPLYPFANDGTNEERLLQWPSKAGSPWLFGNTPVQASWTSNHPWSTQCDAGPWVRVGQNWFVLLESNVGNFGASWLEAGVVGLAIRALQSAVGRLNSWISDSAANDWNVPMLALGGIGPGQTLDVLADVVGSPGLSIIPVWADWITGRAGEPLHVVVDPALGGTSGSGMQVDPNQIIRARTQTLVSTSAWPGHSARPAFANLETAAQWHWARQTYGATPILDSTPQWIPYDTLLAAADHVARVAGLLAHETLHHVWRKQFGVPFGSATPADSPSGADVWGCVCTGGLGNRGNCGPTLSTPGNSPPWRTYQFIPSSTLDQAGSNASKHYVHYLLQRLVQGLLIHDVYGALEDSGGCWP